MSMRKFINILNEYRQISVPFGIDEKVFITINPDAVLLKQLLDKSEYKELRGYFYNNEFYFWDKDEYTHEDFTNELGVNYDESCGLYINYSQSFPNVIVLSPSRGAEIYPIPAKIRNSPYIQDLFIPNEKNTILRLRPSLTEDDDTNNPISAVVMPLKQDAIARSEQEAKKIISKVISDFEKVGWDLDKAAPMGNSRFDSREGYLQKQAKNNLYKSLTTYVSPTRISGQPNLRKQSPDAEQKFIDDAKRDAAEQYDLFVGKLESKIGPVVDAKLQGSHVWGYSILTVTKPDNTIEKWKTQQIVNVSKLGKLFNQWPTRKIK